MAWTTVAVMSFINFVSNPLYMAHVLELPAGTFYPDIIRNVISCGVITACLTGLSRLYTPHGWLSLILCAGVCGVMGAVLHVGIACSREQQKALVQLIKR